MGDVNLNAASETPQIISGYYSSTAGSPADIGSLDLGPAFSRCARNDQFNLSLAQMGSYQPTTQKEIMADKTTRRIVQVFIADPNDNVPLEKSVLYTGPQRLTDLNDTELFFEIPNLQDLIKSHNETRKVTLDREASKRSGKDIFLDPVKIRDLRMVVVTVAQF